ncbi:MAG: glucose-1-phosphate adenylyltransferase subunit GlgD [Eubacteriales bacterium]
MKNVLGIITTYDESTDLRDLTDHRTIAAVPFGGHYRVIDFMMSSMVNSNITHVGVVLRDKYQSLIDHIGNGKEWDLARKIGGVRLLPPYSYARNAAVFNAGDRSGTLEGLIGIVDFIKKSRADHVVIADGNIITNIDLEKVVTEHKDSEADITVVCTKKTTDNQKDVFYKVNRKHDITEICVSIDLNNKCTHTGLGIYVMKKSILMDLITVWASHNYKHFELEGLNWAMKSMNLKAYVHDSYAAKITDVRRYYDANMDLLNKDVRDQLFLKKRPIRTKVHDEQPTYYSETSHVCESLIADGCTLEGSVENSILFRDVHVEKGAVLKNSIVLKRCTISEGANAGHIIADQHVFIGKDKTIMGHKNYPVVITKSSVV